MLLFRDIELRKLTWFVTADWAGYPVVNPTLLSTRGGGAPAIAWAYVHKIGREGYRELALTSWRVTQEILAGIAEIPGIHPVGDDGVDDVRIHRRRRAAGPGHPGGHRRDGGARLAARLRSRGTAGRRRRTCACMAVHAPQVEQFLADLAASVESARELGRVVIDPGLLALAESLDVDALSAAEMGAVLAGRRDLAGQRRAARAAGTAQRDHRCSAQAAGRAVARRGPRRGPAPVDPVRRAGG